jgi:SAM-dependent methyltransferase
VTKPHPKNPYFETIGDALGANYLRYAFTKGTDQEVGFLLETLGLEDGARVLDVGCGAGRHAQALASAGLDVTGVDISARLLEIARTEAANRELKIAFFRMDAREMPFEDEFDAVISLCQGAFGLMGVDDSLVLRKMQEAVKPGGVVVLTAFSALFEARHPRPEADLDADSGIVHERSKIRPENGAEQTVDLWTGVYTPRELRLLAIGVGLIPEHVWGVAPGDFAARPPDLERPEFMILARKPL